MNEVTQRSLPELVTRAKSTLEGETGSVGPAIDSLASAIAALVYGNYGYLDQLAKEMRPETCSEAWLYMYGEQANCSRLLPTFAMGKVKFEQLGDVITIFNGTRIKINELIFETIATQQSNEEIEVIAVQSGTDSNLAYGAELKLVTAISGINPSKILCLGFGGGAELESVENWRERVVSAINNVQSIGKAEDYESWAIDAHSDVQLAWALDNTPTLGHVKVIVCAQKYDPLLSPQVLETVQNAFELNRLAGCHPFAANPTTVAVNFEISGVTDLNIRENVSTEIKQFLLSKMGLFDRKSNLLASISPTELIVRINSITANFLLHSPSTVLQPENDQVLVFGGITWI